MRVNFEDTGLQITEDIEISATKKEIENAIKMLQDLLRVDAMSQELVFHNNGGNCIYFNKLEGID